MIISTRYRVFSKSCANGDRPRNLRHSEPLQGKFCRNRSTLVRLSGALLRNGAFDKDRRYAGESNTVYIFAARINAFELAVQRNF